MPKYQCIQFGVCPKADACEQFEIGGTPAFECPRKDPLCSSRLVEIKSGGIPRGLIAALAIVALLAIGGGAWYYFSRAPKGPAAIQQQLMEVWPWLNKTP